MTKITTSTIQIKGIIKSLLEIRQQEKEEVKETIRKNRIRKGFDMIDNLGIKMSDVQLDNYIDKWFMVG